MLGVRWTPDDAVRPDCVMALAGAGEPDRVLISSDPWVAHRERGKGRAWSHTRQTVRQLMRYTSIDQALNDQFLVDNPRDYPTIR